MDNNLKAKLNVSPYHPFLQTNQNHIIFLSKTNLVHIYFVRVSNNILNRRMNPMDFWFHAIQYNTNQFLDLLFYKLYNELTKTRLY